MEIRLEDERVARLWRAGLPFVTIGHTAHPDGTCWVDVDYATLVTRCVHHLADPVDRRSGRPALRGGLAASAHRGRRPRAGEGHPRRRAPSRAHRDTRHTTPAPPAHTGHLVARQHRAGARSPGAKTRATTRMISGISTLVLMRTSTPLMTNI